MNNSPTGNVPLTETEVTEEPITPQKNRPWKYIPQFSDEECRMLRVEKSGDNGDGEEEEDREASDGLLQYYRRNRALEAAEDDVNGDMEIVELSKAVYGKPSSQSKDEVEVQEELIVPVKIERRTEMEDPQETEESLSGNGVVPSDGAWAHEVPEPEVEVENLRSMTFDTPEYIVEGEEAFPVLQTELSPPEAFDDHFVEFPVRTEGAMMVDFEAGDENPRSGLYHEQPPVLEEEKAENALDSGITGPSFSMEGEGIGAELKEAIIELRQTGTVRASNWFPCFEEEGSVEASDVVPTGSPVSSGQRGIAESQANGEMPEELIAETKFVSPTFGVPVFSYDVEVDQTEEKAAAGSEPLLVEKREERRFEESVPGDTDPLSDVTVAAGRGREDTSSEILDQEPVKTLPGHQGSTLPPSGTRTLPERSSRPRRSKSESFFGFLRKKSKTKDGEDGEEKKADDDRGRGGGGGAADDTEGGKSKSGKTTPTIPRSKTAKNDDSKIKTKAGQTQKTSFLQKLGFGRGSTKSDKQSKEGKGQQSKEGKGQQEKEDDDEESQQKIQAETKSSASKQSAGKTNIRIFEILAKNNEEESVTSPDASKSSPSNTSEVGKEEGARTTAESKEEGAGTAAEPELHSELRKQTADVIISDSDAVKAAEKVEARTEASVTHPLVQTHSHGGTQTPSGPSEEAGEVKGVDKQATPLAKAATEAGGNALPVDDYLVIGDTLKSSVAADTKVASSAPSVKRNYIVAVAIDFGTAFSGYAFCFLHNPDSIHMMSRWEDGDPGVINQKTPTTLLLTPQGQFHSFGFSARNNYHDLSSEDSKEWLYFDRFKMALYATKDCSQAMTIEAANGKRFSGLEAISMTLRFFRDHALQQISSQSDTKIHNDDVLWIVTVPAIWNASAKQLMRLAAYKADLASPETPDQLLVALEPEAASVHIRRLQLRHLVPDKPVVRPLSVRVDCVDPSELVFLSSQFNNVVRYVVVDCGGGTVDITVHEMNAINHRLQELQAATGGPHGSFAIDRDFEWLLGEIFGREFIESYRRERPSGWIGLMMAFESRKRAADPRRTNPLNVALPFSFIEYYRKTKGASVDDAIKAHGDKGVRWSSQGMLRLSQDVMKKLFRPTLDRIKEAIENVLDAVRGIDYIFLVGGLSESGLLQCEVRDQFKDRVKKVVIPQEANLAVIKGAVTFGLDPSVIAGRRSKLTYGAAVLNRFIHGKHPESKLVQKEGVEWCRDVFDVFVSAGQVVRAGEAVVRQYIPAAPSQKRIVIGIYSSEDRNPGYISTPGVRKCANVSLDLTTPDHGVIQGSGPLPALSTRRRIQAELVFAETEIKVMATDTTTGKQVNASIDFLNV